MILVIEDDEPMVLLLRALAPKTRRVDWAASLADGVAALKMRAHVLHDPYFAAVVDMRLPDSDVFETIARIDEIVAASPQTKVVLMTGAGVETLPRVRPDVPVLDKAHGEFAHQIQAILT